MMIMYSFYSRNNLNSKAKKNLVHLKPNKTKKIIINLIPTEKLLVLECGKIVQ